MISFKRVLHGLPVSVAVALIAGCAQTPRQNSSEYHEWAFTQARTVEIPVNVADTLETAQVGDVIQIGATSIGAESTYSISERYFAASGRPCFKGQLVSDQSQQSMVVCRYSRNQWVATRAVVEKFDDNQSTVSESGPHWGGTQ